MPTQLPITKPSQQDYQETLGRFYEASVGLARLEHEKRLQAKAYTEEIKDQREFVRGLAKRLEEMKAALEEAA